MADTILVTGGAGYIGSHVVVELARAGYAPVVLDNFSNSTPAVLPRLQALSGRPIPCVTADVREVTALRSAFHDHPITAVVHCAGLKSVGESQARPHRHLSERGASDHQTHRVGWVRHLVAPATRRRSNGSVGSHHSRV